MNIGKMDRQIVVERNTPTRSVNGAEKASWATLVTLWADKRAQSASEALRDGKILTTETAWFFTHYYSGITTKDRISEGGRYWNIRQVREIGREGLELLAEAME